MSFSLFGMFKSIARSDRQKGPRGGVAFPSRLTCNLLAEEINSNDFDFAAAAVIQLSGDSDLLIVLVYLPYPSPYEVSFDVMERSIDSIFSSFQKTIPSAEYSHSVWVLGDFNFPSTDWILMHSHSTREQQFLDLFFLSTGCRR